MQEEQNTDSIWLYREGIFMKAYERSAFFAHTLIHEFKLFKRYIKTVNMDVISLGFPEQTIPKWLNGYVYDWVQDGLLRRGRIQIEASLRFPHYLCIDICRFTRWDILSKIRFLYRRQYSVPKALLPST